MNVLIIFGGYSSEHDVSRVSAASVLDNIDRDKFSIYPVGIDKKGKWFLTDASADEIRSGKWENRKNIPCTLNACRDSHELLLLEGNIKRIFVDVAFPVLHGAFGEDGTIQGLFEMANLPYVGSPVDASANCMDKSITKVILRDAGIPQADWVTVTKQDCAENLLAYLGEIENKLGFPVFVKPARAGSSVGINKAHNMDELKSAIDNAFLYDNKLVVEEFIKGREIETAVLGNNSPLCSGCGEIIPAREFYDYVAKYEDNSSVLKIPAVLAPLCEEVIAETALHAYKTMGCRGLSRIDFFVCEDESIILNEINTLPGFTSISMYPKLFAHKGLDFTTLITELINYAMESKNNG